MGLINMKINDKLHGFTITNIRNTNDGEFVEMHHDKTNARLAWMNNGEENKLFCISFKTVPVDDTGVFHILEHSVLGGSENYPVKEPFLYLLKGSMNTFLNAMTFSDKTMYPVSSRNNRDFMNLTRVYLDAVFKPLIYTVPNIFYQEGHHTELADDVNDSVYKGVVFNEMKGYISSVHERIESEMNRLLFPDTSYKFEFGGLPTAITNLTYDQFIDVHKRYYNPANSYIYLDGEINPDEVLTLIDSYLTEFEDNGEQPKIVYQSHTESCTQELFYDSSAECDTENQSYLAVGKILADWQEIEKITAYNVLTEAIAGCNDSPFKKAILDTEMCLDVNLSVTDGILQPVGTLKFNNMDRENGEKLLESAERTARYLVKNGIDRDILEAAINRCEFKYRESEEPKGLIRCIESMASWLYGGDPLMYIDRSGAFDILREKLDSRYFEDLLEEWLLNEKGRKVLYMLPSATYGEEQAKAEKERILSEISAMSEDEKSELIKLNENLAQWQNTPDSDDAVATLPQLPLSEISPEPIEYKTEETFEKGIIILRHPVRENEITVMTLYFDINDLTKDQLKKLLILDRLIAELPTEKSDGLELQKKIVGTLGNLTTEIIPIGKEEDSESCRVFFAMKTRFLSRNLDEALNLLGELLTETVYDYPEIASRQLKQDEEEMKQDIISAGHRFSVRRTTAHISAESAFIEFIRGYEAYCTLHEVNQLSESDFSAMLTDLKSLADVIFCKSRMTVSIGSAGETSISALADILPQGEPCGTEKMKFSLEIPNNSAISIPSATCCSGAVLSEKISNKAEWNVASTILSYEFLWNEVRVKGGAYGAGCSVNNMNEVSFYSYCDPSPLNSMGIYEKTADFLEKYCSENPDITSYIISTVSSGEPLVSDADYVATADFIYFRGITQEHRRNNRREILEMTCEKLMSICDDMKKPIYTCLTGSDEVAEEAVEKRKSEICSVY